MNRLNFRTLNFGHKAGHAMYHYVSNIYRIYNITDAVFFVHMLSLTNHGKHCRHPTILTRYGIAWQLTMLSYGISKNIPRAWTLDFP